MKCGHALRPEPAHTHTQTDKKYLYLVLRTLQSPVINCCLLSLSVTPYLSLSKCFYDFARTHARLCCFFSLSFLPLCLSLPLLYSFRFFCYSNQFRNMDSSCIYHLYSQSRSESPSNTHFPCSVTFGESAAAAATATCCSLLICLSRRAMYFTDIVSVSVSCVCICTIVVIAN